MLIDERTKKLLDIDRVLAELHPITPFGLKCKNAIKSFSKNDKDILDKELERIEKLKQLIEYQKPVFIELKNHMRQVKDVRKSVERAIQGGILTTVELFELKNLNHIMQGISRNQEQLQWHIPEKYKVRELKWLDGLLDPDKSGILTFYIYDSYSNELGIIRNQKQKLEHQYAVTRKQIIKDIEKKESISIKLNGEISVTRSSLELIEKLKQNEKLQILNETYMNTTFKIKSDEIMLKLTEQIQRLKSEEIIEESRILEILSAKIAVNGSEIVKNIDALGEFDLLLAKAYLAIAQKAIKPIIGEDTICIIKNGRNPVVEAELKKKDKKYTPITVKLKQNVTIITGANMGGKTVSLKMMGLLIAMVHYGLLVPADYMELSLLDFVFVSAGDQQSIDQGLSTFGAEMKGIKDILSSKCSSGLILIDELARGTNPHEGHAISYAIIDYLMGKPYLSVITTHFDGLVREGIKHLQVNGIRNIDVNLINSPELISEHMDYTLVEIEGNVEVPRDAIKISRMMGIPEDIIKKAEQIMDNKNEENQPQAFA